jgi:hypothetical protein
MGPDLAQPVRVNSAGRTVPLGECGPTQLAAAIAVAGRDLKRMVKRDAPARLYTRRTGEFNLYQELARELATAKLPRVKLLGAHVLERAESLVPQ